MFGSRVVTPESEISKKRTIWIDETRHHNTGAREKKTQKNIRLEQNEKMVTRIYAGAKTNEATRKGNDGRDGCMDGRSLQQDTRQSVIERLNSKT